MDLNRYNSVFAIPDSVIENLKTGESQKRKRPVHQRKRAVPNPHKRLQHKRRRVQREKSESESESESNYEPNSDESDESSDDQRSTDNASDSAQTDDRKTTSDEGDMSSSSGDDTSDFSESEEEIDGEKKRDKHHENKSGVSNGVFKTAKLRIKNKKQRRSPEKEASGDSSYGNDENETYEQIFKKYASLPHGQKIDRLLSFKGKRDIKVFAKAASNLLKKQLIPYDDRYHDMVFLFDKLPVEKQRSKLVKNPLLFRVLIHKVIDSMR